MANGSYRTLKRNSAKKALAKIASNASYVNVIHYSCESFYDRPNGRSPRVTSIAVANFETGLAKSFSIHQMAERAGLPHDEIEANYDDLEKSMLDEFYNYVRSCERYSWLHWNMTNSNYGFPALAHRYKVLKGEPVDIPDNKFFNLPAIFLDLYGNNYISHQRLPNLIAKNSMSDKDVLGGADEAKAFVDKEYFKLHQSTLRKVDIISSLGRRAHEGRLKTEAKFVDIYGYSPSEIAESIKDHWGYTLIGLLSAFVGIIGFLLLFK